MNDKDFDQIFSDKLNEESLFEGANDNWQKLNFRLDLIPPPMVVQPPVPQVVPTVPTIGWHQGWMYAAMSALTVGNVWLWLQMRDVSRQNEGLQKAVAAVQAGRKDTVYRIDTVYQKVYLIDNQSDNGKTVPITKAEYSALSAVSVPSLESKKIKNEVVIDTKNRQNNTQTESKKTRLSRNNPFTTAQKSETTSRATDNWGYSTEKKQETTSRATDNWANSGVKKSENKAPTLDNQDKEGVETIDLKSINRVENAVSISIKMDKSVENRVENSVENTIPMLKNSDNFNTNVTNVTFLKAENSVFEQNNSLKKSTIALAPLESRPLSAIEAFTKMRERMRVADAIEPIRIQKRNPLFPKMGIPEIHLGAVVISGFPNRKPTNGFGLGAEVDLSQHWSLLVSGEKHFAHFEMEDRDKRFRLPPEPMVPNGHRLRRLRGDFEDKRLSVGAKYVFLIPKKYRLYVTGQHVWKETPNSMVDFEYETVTGGKENFKQTLEGQLLTNIWQVGSGVTGNLNRRISWNVGFNYMFDFNKQPNNTAPMTFRAGVFYRL